MMKGHAKWEYIIHTSKDDKHYYYEVETLKDSWDFATDWKPIFRTKRKQEAIELCNALNRITKTDMYKENRHLEKIETKNYTFTKDKYSYWKLESYKQDSITRSLIELIHRRNEEIAELERKLHNQSFEAIKYKIIAKKLYDKLHAIPETDLYRELIKEAELGHEELCDMIHDEMKMKGIR